MTYEHLQTLHSEVPGAHSPVVVETDALTYRRFLKSLRLPPKERLEIHGLPLVCIEEKLAQFVIRGRAGSGDYLRVVEGVVHHFV